MVSLFVVRQLCGGKSAGGKTDPGYQGDYNSYFIVAAF